MSELPPAVVADGTSQVDAAAAATGAVARENSAVGDEPGLSSWADLQENKNGTQCLPCETYFPMLVMSVEDRLLSLLKGDPAVGGINLEGALHEQHPLTMETTGCMTTTKEHWRWDNCRMSLLNKGLYHSAGSLFWFSKAQPRWEGAILAGCDLTYGQMSAGRVIWSDEKYLRSSDDPSKRRYSIRSAIPHHVNKHGTIIIISITHLCPHLHCRNARIHFGTSLISAYVLPSFNSRGLSPSFSYHGKWGYHG
jgi:hypothetical protein